MEWAIHGNNFLLVLKDLTFDTARPGTVAERLEGSYSSAVR